MPNTMLSVHLELENATAEVQTVFLEKGRCFEIANPCTGLQNAALAENVQIAIPPHGKVAVDVPAHCLNRYRNMFDRHDANVTQFILADRCVDQSEIWEKMAFPAAA